MFLSRESELSELNALYNKKGFKFIVVYGRRRVGKTSIINEFCKDKEHIFYISIEQNDKAAIESFSNQVLEVFPVAKSMLDVFPSWDKLFEYIASSVGDKRIILAIDEYPYLASGNPSISSILQKHIDTTFSKSNIFLLLCGSSMSFMENQVLGYKSPLYGRRTAQFRIEPFDYYDSSLFFGNMSYSDKIMAYGAAGGIPQYLGIIAEHENIEKGIYESFFKKSGHLYEEPENLLKQDLREPAIYNSIIAAIANGASKLNEISTKSGEDNKKCSKYLKSLVDLQIVKKEYSQGAKSERNSIYKLEDNMFKFWYRFVPKNISNIESGLGEQVLKLRVMPQMSEYLGRIFEEVARSYMIRRNIAMSLPFMFNTIGRWWGSNPATRTQEEIDILAEYEDNAIFGECKWRNEYADESVLNRLIEKSLILHYFKNKTYMIFSKSGFSDGLIKAARKNGNVELIDLNAMFEKI